MAEKSYKGIPGNTIANVLMFFRKTFSPFESVVSNEYGAKIKNSPVMFCCTHRSHLDYFILGSLIYRYLHIRRIRFAAGDNLTKLPWLGRSFIGWGAFAVKRDKAGVRSQLRALCDSVAQMLIGGDSIIVFPEGGRSYGGAMLELKNGILGAGAMAGDRSPQLPLFFMPVSITYQYLPELQWFSAIEKGKKILKKSKNPLMRLIGTVYYFGSDLVAMARVLLARRFKIFMGGIYVDFDQPYRLDEMVDVAANKSDSRDEFLAHRKSMDIIAQKIAARLFVLYRILPHHMVAALMKTGKSYTMAELQNRIADLRVQVRATGRNTKTIDALTDEQIISQGVNDLVHEKAVYNCKGQISVRNELPWSYYAATLTSKSTPEES